MAFPDPTVVYTDGACSGNPGPGGWAWAVPGGGWASGAEARTTNQRMEITAAWRAVEANAGHVEVVSDSTYVVNCFRDRWWEGWIARGWKNSQRKPVANRDLWEPFVALVRQRIAAGDQVRFRWVKGHSGNPMNDLVDRLAVEAATTQRGRSGDEPPAVAGRAELEPFERADEAKLPGRPVGVFGPRARDLEARGVGEAEVADAVRATLATLVDDVASGRAGVGGDGSVVVVSGLRLGAELAGAEAAAALGVPLVAVLPYPDPEAPWPAADQERFRRWRDAADEVVLLETSVPDGPRGAAGALARRDGWLARHLAAAVVVRAGADDGLDRLERSLVDHLGAEAVRSVTVGGALPGVG